MHQIQYSTLLCHYVDSFLLCYYYFIIERFHERIEGRFINCQVSIVILELTLVAVRNTIHQNESFFEELPLFFSHYNNLMYT